MILLILSSISFILKTPQEKAPHPLDVQYGLLSCDLELVDKKSKEFKVSYQSGHRKVLECYRKTSPNAMEFKILFV